MEEAIVGIIFATVIAVGISVIIEWIMH